MSKLLIVGLGTAIIATASSSSACTLRPLPVFMADQTATDIAIVEVARVSTAIMTEPLAGWRDTIEFRIVDVVRGAPPSEFTRVWGRPDATPDCPFQEQTPALGERYAAWFKSGNADGVLYVKRLDEVQREAPWWLDEHASTPSSTTQSED